jgi:hypothetical protein
MFVPFQRAIFRQRAWAIVQAVSPAAILNEVVVHVLTLEQVSLLISFELPTIPSSTTA